MCRLHLGESMPVVTCLAAVVASFAAADLLPAFIGALHRAVQDQPSLGKMGVGCIRIVFWTAEELGLL